jgi:hypothetical protein
MKSFSSKKAKAGAKPRQNSNRGSGLSPPQFNMQPTNRRRMRFVNEFAGDLNTQITSLDILGALGSIVTGVGTGHSIAASFRIRKVEIWATPKSDSDGAWQSASIEWKNSTSFSKSTKVMDASNSNALPLHISTSPPPLSVCDLWVHGPAVELFHIKVPTGAIIDLIVDYLLADTNEPLVITYASAPTVGRMIYAKLDQTTSNVCPQIDTQY